MREDPNELYRCGTFVLTEHKNSLAGKHYELINTYMLLVSAASPVFSHVVCNLGFAIIGVSLSESHTRELVYMYCMSCCTL